MKQVIHFALALFIAPVVSAAAIDEYEALSSIRDKAESYIISQLNGRQAKIKANTLDSRLKLKKCNKPLEVYPAPGNKRIGRVTVGVRCTSDNPWSIYVPVHVSVKIQQVVSSEPLSKGHILSKDDLVVISKYVTTDRNKGYQVADKLIGKQLKRNLQSNTVIKPNYVTSKATIKRGSMVVIRSRNPSLNVSMKGKALQKGSIGDIIRVKNMTSKRTVDAKIISNGIVSPIGS